MEKKIAPLVLNFNCNLPTFLNYLEEIIVLDKQMTYSWSRQNWLELKDSDHYFISIMRSGGRVIGFSLFSKIDLDLHLLKIVVDQSFRGNGHGQKLLITDLNDHYNDLKSCYLEVRSDNKTAVFLYQKLGFKLVHKVSNFYSDGCSALKMILTYSNT